MPRTPPSWPPATEAVRSAAADLALLLELTLAAADVLLEPIGAKDLVRLAYQALRGHRGVIAIIGLSRPSGEHLAEQISDMLAEGLAAPWRGRRAARPARDDKLAGFCRCAAVGAPGAAS
jgi:hypothetical protein